MTHDAPPELYLRGIGLFNGGEYFEAHEAWEDLWRVTRGPNRVFYQALIQAAVALEHCRRGNPGGAANLWRSCRAKFDALPAQFMGLDLAGLASEMEEALGPALAPERTTTPFQPSPPPRIRMRIP